MNLFRDRFAGLPYIKSLGILMVTIGIIPMLFYALIWHQITADKYSQMEYQAVTTHVSDFQRVMDTHGKAMDKLAQDHARWNLAYESIQKYDFSTLYINYIDWFLKNNGLDQLLLLNSNGEVMTDYGLSQEQIRAWTEHPAVQAAMKQDSPPTVSNPQAQLMEDATGFYLVSVAPVVREGIFPDKPAGVLIISREVTADLLQALPGPPMKDAHLVFGTHVLSASETSDEDQASILQNVQASPGPGLQGQWIKAPFKDLSGGQAGWILLKAPQGFPPDTLKEMLTTSLMILIPMGMFLFILAQRLSKAIVLPIHDLESQIRRMKDQQIIEDVVIRGPQEIMQLADTFNGMHRSIHHYRAQTEVMKDKSYTDALTGLYNIRYLEESVLPQLLETQGTYSVLFGDIDLFKSVNDHFGHDIGDRVLSEVADIIRESVDESSLVFRYGGEEFLIIIPNVGKIEAYRIGESIRKELLTHRGIREHCGNKAVTISFGVAAYPADGKRPQMIIKNADRALYYAKRKGRNRVSLFNEEVVSDEAQLLRDGELLPTHEQPYKVDLEDTSGLRDGARGPSMEAYGVLLAQELLDTEKEVHLIRFCAHLHERVEMTIPKDFTDKLDRLNIIELDQVKRNLFTGAHLIEYIMEIEEVRNIIMHHHERWDGMGYPAGLSGEQIPYGSRILAVVEAYNAMVSPKLQRVPMDSEEAQLELLKNKGTQFDPNIVDAFVRLLHGRNLRDSSEETAVTTEALIST